MGVRRRQKAKNRLDKAVPRDFRRAALCGTCTVLCSDLLLFQGEIASHQPYTMSSWKKLEKAARVPSTAGSVPARLVSELPTGSVAAPLLLLIQEPPLPILLLGRFRLHSKTRLSGRLYFCELRTQTLFLSAQDRSVGKGALEEHSASHISRTYLKEFFRSRSHLVHGL